MPVNSAHPDYLNKIDEWKFMRDIMKGNVKHKLMDLEIICGGPREFVDRARIRNERFRNSGILANFTLQTKLALVAIALKNEFTIELPPELQYLLEESSGNVLKIEQLIQQLLGEQVDVGRVGLLTDYPAVDVGLTQTQVKRLNLRPRGYMYIAENIINWDVDSTTGNDDLSLVVLKELALTRGADKYQWNQEERYRVLMIDEEGYYTQAVFNDDLDCVEGPYRPVANGAYWTKIPFRFIGSENNDVSCDACPLKSIAEVNMGHYMNSCLYEDNLRKHGQSTTVITSDMRSEDWKSLMKGRPLVMGSDEIYFLGKTGDIKTTQLGPNQEAATAMRHKEDQMAMLCAHIVLASAVNAPVETTRINSATRTSLLKTMVLNLQDGIRDHLRDCATYMGANPDAVEFNMSTDFVDNEADPAMIAELGKLVAGRLLPTNPLWNYLRLGEIITETDEELTAALANEGALGIGVGFDTNVTQLTDQSGGNANTNLDNIDRVNEAEVN